MKPFCNVFVWFEYSPYPIQKSLQNAAMSSDLRQAMVVKLQLLKLCLLSSNSKVVQFHFETQYTGPCGLCQQAVLVLEYEKFSHADSC